MSMTKIDTNAVISTKAYSSSMKTNVKNLRDEIRSAFSCLDPKIKARCSCSSAISALNELITGIDNLERTVQSGAEKYRNNEKYLCMLARDLMGGFSVLAGTLTGSHSGAGSSNDDKKSDFYMGEKRDEEETENGKYADEEAFYERDDTKKKKHAESTFGDKDQKLAEKKGTAFEKAFLEWETPDCKISDGELAGSNDFASGKLTYELGSAEANAKVAGGLYAYDDDGKKSFSPGVCAEMGASVTGLNLTAEGRLGTESPIGLYGKAEANVLKAEAKAEAGLGMVDGNFQANATASAEALLGEIEGSAGVTVMGTDIGVTASANVGIGAHADFGYKDGKIKVDLGASLGVGASIGFEIDASKTIEAAQETAVKAWDFFVDIFS
ncbi:MAG: hypothetical protein RSA79_06645 [Oscillospiraceae bacterium]